MIKNILIAIKYKQYGDAMYFFTRGTGIYWIVNKIKKLTGKDCGCDKRRKNWNK